MFSLHDFDAVESFCRTQRVDRHRWRRVQLAFYRNQCDWREAVDEMSADKRELLRDSIRPHVLALAGRHDSQLDGATRLVFQTARGARIETVILRVESGRTSLCVSSQAGCAAHCEFCATGYLGLVHQLSADEILDQVAQANQLLRAEGRRVRNMVFMGMGEPLHNEHELHRALEVLFHPLGFGLSPKRVSVSTVGVPAAMRRLVERFPRVRMALSLHRARQQVRERIVPLARKHSLDELRGALEQVAAPGQLPVMIEYLMLSGVNDGPGDCRALAEFLAGLSVHVNLIPFNPIAEAPHLTGSDRATRVAFADRLREAGYTVTLRYSLGADVAAACGQLAAKA